MSLKTQGYIYVIYPFIHQLLLIKRGTFLKCKTAPKGHFLARSFGLASQYYVYFRSGLTFAEMFPLPWTSRPNSKLLLKYPNINKYINTEQNNIWNIGGVYIKKTTTWKVNNTVQQHICVCTCFWACKHPGLERINIKHPTVNLELVCVSEM